ncbi:WXG100 family type VII secretion target [Actinophytocola sp. NPDC049390]|uniref:WXG100 family type VII secretion target n=1 Tax=Actinophytocola sp. NPDC049390 TaxID=3363894 RepID=UPI003797003D
MTVAEPTHPLWTFVKSHGIEWPADVEEVAADLGAAWHAAADGLTEGGTTARAVGADLTSSWADTSGGTAQTRAAEIGAGLDHVQQGLRRQGDQAIAYAESLIRTKQGIQQVIATFAPFWDLLDPRNRNQMEQWVIDLVNSAGEKATEAIRWLLTVESQGPQTEPFSWEGPNDSGRLGSLSVDGAFDHGRWSAFGGALQGEYAVGPRGEAQVNAPWSRDPLVDAEVRLGASASLDRIDVIDSGPVKLGFTPEVSVGPGATFTFDPKWENGRFDLNARIGASPMIGGSLGTDFSIDFNEIGKSLFPTG